MPRHPGFQDGVNLCVSLCLTYVICISCVRVWIRKGCYGSDDVVIAVATAISFLHSAADYLALANGLGTPWDHIVETGSVPTLNATSVAGVVLFTTALYLTKCATLTFLSRITKARSQIMLYHIINGLVATIGIISVLIVSVACPSETFYWDFYDNQTLLSCPTQSTRWQVFTGLDIVTEILLLVLPIQLVWGLQMRLSKKGMIVMAFSLRLPVVGFSMARNCYTLQLRLAQTDSGGASGLVVIWIEVQLAYALASSTLSASKAFTESFNSGFGLGFTRNAYEDSYGLSHNSGKSGASKDEKLGGDTTVDSGNTSVTRSPPRSRDPYDVRIVALLTEPPGHHTSLSLRPEHEGKTTTSVSAQPSYPDHGPWSTGSASSSYYSNNDDMNIHAETSVEVHCDDAPMLRRTPGAYI